MTAILMLHVLVFVIRPLREVYARWMPSSAIFSVGLLAGWLVGSWVTAFGAPGFCAPASALIWGFGLVRMAAETGWSRQPR